MTILAASQHDRAYATSTHVVAGAAGTPYFALTHACESTFNLVGFLGTAELSCDVVPVTFDRCTRIQSRFGAELDRVTGALPAIAHPTKFCGWFVGALPAPTLRPRPSSRSHHASRRPRRRTPSSRPTTRSRMAARTRATRSA